MNDETHYEPSAKDVALRVAMFVSDLRHYAFGSTQYLKVLALPKTSSKEPLSEDEQKHFLDAVMQNQEKILVVATELQEYFHRLRQPDQDQGDQR